MKYLLLLSFLLVFAAVRLPVTADSRGNRGQDGTGRSPEELRVEAAELEASIRRAPSDIELYIRLGFVYTRLEQADDAQRAFESAVGLDPKRAIAHYMLGLIYEKKGMKDRAIAAWRACLENAGEERLRETARKHLHHLK